MAYSDLSGRQPDIKLVIRSGWFTGFNKQWENTGTYNVTVTENEPFSSLVSKLKDQLGENVKQNANGIWGVDKRSGNRIEFDHSKTCKENGITVASKPELRILNTVARTK
ncbi:hypothetical protein QOT17_008785 [Balamuthia mandrillaris]